MKSLKILSGNTLKIIAAVSMLLDHAGVMLFPEYNFLRIVGRLAFPIFAFMISEGCNHTKNKLRYFLSVFLLGVVCQTVYLFTEQSFYMGILITFSLSIILIFSLQKFKKELFEKNSSALKKILCFLIFVILTVLVFLLNRYVEIDYGFFGCFAPVFANILTHPYSSAKNSHNLNLFMFGVGLVLLAESLDAIQYYSLFALVPLWMYSGKRGNLNMKYFFYVFYPLHLVALHFVYNLFFA